MSEEKMLSKANSRPFLRRFRIKARLIVSFLLLSILPLGICGVFSYNQSRSAIDSKIRTYSTQIINQVSNSIKIEIDKVKNIATDIIIDKNSIQNGLEELSSDDSYTKLQAEQKIESFLSGKLTSIREISSIGIYFNDRSSIYSGLSGEVEQTQVEQLIALVEKSEGKGAWALLPKDNNNLDLAYVSPIKSMQIGESYGYIIIVLSNKLLESTYRSIDIGEGAVFTVIDTNGKIVSGLDGFIDNADRSVDLMNTALELEKSNTNIFYDNSDGIGSLISYSRVKDTEWFVIAAIPNSYLNAESNNIRNTIIIISVVSILLAFFISSVIAKSVSVPSNRLIGMMMEAKSGNLALKISDNSNDELGHITNHFNDMLANLCHIIIKTGESTKTVLFNSEKIALSASQSHDVSEQVALTIQHIAKGASEQAAETIQGVNHMNDLSEGINKVGENMTTVIEVVNQTKDLCENAFITVNTLNEKAAMTSEVSEHTIGDISDLSEDMKKIKSIIKVIGDISEQTNLLSLNAAIEASRAGTAGLGFAVVAEEVKKLAYQSKEAATSIGNIINSIQRKADKTVKSAQDANDIIVQQMDTVKETDNAFKVIYNSMKSIIANMNNMDSSVKEILTSKEKAFNSIEKISFVAEEAASTAQEVAASTQEQMATSEELASFAKSLDQMAQSLNSEISRFNVNY